MRINPCVQGHIPGEKCRRISKLLIADYFTIFHYLQPECTFTQRATKNFSQAKRSIVATTFAPTEEYKSVLSERSTKIRVTFLFPSEDPTLLTA